MLYGLTEVMVNRSFVLASKAVQASKLALTSKPILASKAALAGRAPGAAEGLVRGGPLWRIFRGIRGRGEIWGDPLLCQNVFSQKVKENCCNFL